MTPRFKRAYDLLIKAYFNDELKAGECSACAVGSICSKNWSSLFLTGNNHRQNKWWLENKSGYIHLIEEVEDETMYSVQQLADVEFAFETNTLIKTHDYEKWSPSEILSDQFNGLKAVIELMQSFDNIEGVQYVDKLKEKLQPA